MSYGEALSVNVCLESYAETLPVSNLTDNSARLSVKIRFNGALTEVYLQIGFDENILNKNVYLGSFDTYHDTVLTYNYLNLESASQHFYRIKTVNNRGTLYGKL